MSEIIELEARYDSHDEDTSIALFHVGGFDESKLPQLLSSVEIVASESSPNIDYAHDTEARQRLEVELFQAAWLHELEDRTSPVRKENATADITPGKAGQLMVRIVSGDLESGIMSYTLFYPLGKDSLPSD